MRPLIDLIAFFALHSPLVLLLLLFSHHHSYVNGNTEVDINLMPAATHDQQNIAALTNENSHFFHGDGDLLENSDVESVPITVDGGGYGGNVSNGNQAGKLYNWDDYMGSIDMYSESGDNYDYGKYTSIKKSLFQSLPKNNQPQYN